MRPIRFVHRGRTVSLAPGAEGLGTTTTVLQWLREHQRGTGTKEGCNEGDCGACTVLLGTLQPGAEGEAPTVRLQPINSCIALLPTLDGHALLTVEDLGGRHPAQAAMVACHGSQCGFCTPGFVMTMAALHQQHAGAPQPPARAAVADALSGNLCRCTGYRPILDAADQMLAQHPQPAIDTSAWVAPLQALQAEASLHWHDAEGARFDAPRSLPELATQRLQRPQARLLAGGTDIGLWVTKQFRALPDLLYLGQVAGLGSIAEQPADAGSATGWLHIGAGASLEAAWDALAERWPALREMGLRFASPPVRHAGTMGGNLANGSPIGDSAPVLMALGAELLLRQGEAVRWLPLDAFYLGYQRNALAPGEFVQAIRVPLPGLPGSGPAGTLDVVRAYKLSKRHDSDISAVACGLWLRLQHGRVAAARLAFGGMAATVSRARQAEAALTGQPWDDEATVQAAMAALAHDYQPLTDLRATAAYRLRTARAFLHRLWWQSRPGQALAEADSQLWSRP